MLITGGSGQVGGELVKLFPKAWAPGREVLDLADARTIRACIREARPSWILNPAAYTAVDKAEQERGVARAVNAEALEVIGEEARKLGAVVVHFSTDYVFPGDGEKPYTETDATGPLGVYGETKLAGEQALAASGAAHVILRTSWVYGATGKNFLLTVLRVARERAEMRIVDDQHGAPTTARELARVTAGLIDWAGANPAETIEPVRGVYHAAAAGETTWFGFANEALRIRQLAEPETKFAELMPITTSEYPTPARRPANSRLDCGKLARVFGLRFAPWQQGLAAIDSEI
jgi:dTDP-4-dehydrorhamnose reductase